jgi:hypothetical protein
MRAAMGSARKQILAVLLLTLVTAGCSQPPAARLRLAGDPATRVGSANSFVPYGQPLSKGSIMLCLTEPGLAILTDVALTGERGDLSIGAFAVRPRSADDQTPLLGDDFGLLASVTGFEPSGSQEITAVCNDADSGDGPVAFELGIELSWAGGEVAGGAQIELTYLVDGRTVHSSIPWEIWLCRQRCPDEVFVN